MSNSTAQTVLMVFQEYMPRVPLMLMIRVWSKSYLLATQPL